MKERPILFKGEMVRAILAGTKTQTRRIVKYALPWAERFSPAPYKGYGVYPNWIQMTASEDRQNGAGPCPYGVAGDRLWVKETWRVHKSYDAFSPTKVGIAMGGDYAGCIDYMADPRTEDFWGKTRVSIHMPRWASRLKLEIAEARVERLQDISEDDARAEGCTNKLWLKNPFSHGGAGNPVVDRMGSCRESYKELWEEINGPGSWALNPFVWVITFKRVA